MLRHLVKNLINVAKHDHKSTKPQCQGCGKRHRGSREECTSSSHPDFNKSGSWAESQIGKLYKEKLKERYPVLDITKRYNHKTGKFEPFTYYPTAKPNSSSQTHAESSKVCDYYILYSKYLK